MVNKLLTETNANIHINLSYRGKHTILGDPNIQGLSIMSPCALIRVGFLKNNLIYVQIEILRK